MFNKWKFLLRRRIFEIVYNEKNIIMNKEFLRLSKELFLVDTFVYTTVDVNITKVKSHDKKPRDQKQFYTWTPILYIVGGIS